MTDAANSNRTSGNLQTFANQNASLAPTSIGGTLGTTGIPKEQEPLRQETGTIEEIVSDVEIAPELEAIGVQKQSETIVLPPDLKKMGVTGVGPAQPLTTTVQLPISDDQVIVGLHAQILSSLRWLAEWSVRQLKKAHIQLKIIKGKIVRRKL